MVRMPGMRNCSFRFTSHDGDARAAHDCWDWGHGCSDPADTQRPILSRIPLPVGNIRFVLAFCRYRLGFSLPITLSRGSKLMPEHIMEKKIYYAVFGALMVLLAATVLIAYIHLGKLNFIAAVSIAVVKAVLIILYFMHVRYSSRLLWVFVGAGFFWLGILFALSLADFFTRGWLPLP